jgi:D-beta-D-heptose 7-phosphate kinase/D-beta-D-heptose 1-phosphate adenosyltransferase
MNLSDILRRFPSGRVLVVGDLMLDEYVSGDCSRISPEAPVPVLKVSASRSVPGGAANTAANVATLGGHARLVGAIGADDAGRALVRLLEDRGVNLSIIERSGTTPRKVRALGSQQQLLRLDYEAPPLRDPGLAEVILEEVERHIGDSAVLVVSDYAKGLLSADLTQSLLARARAARVPSIVDPRPQHASHYAGADYITPNWREAQSLLGETPADQPVDPARIDAVGRMLASRFSANVLLTLGAHGMRYFPRDGGDVLDDPAQAREVFDVSGAGDTVVAALALSIAAQADIKSAIRIANLAAGVVVGRLGTATVSVEDLALADRLERRLVRRNELSVLARNLRADGKRIVTINGSFDLLHAGHVHILREARTQGDVLIVGLNSDASVRGQKGPDRPFITEEDRARMLLALRDVDYVHVFDELVPMPFLEEVRPDVHVNGSEYGEDCIEAETVVGFGGRIHLVDRLPGLSTSELAARMRRSEDAPQRASGRSRGSLD